jgi:hypothetical protein
LLTRQLQKFERYDVEECTERATQRGRELSMSEVKFGSVIGSHEP